MSTQIQRRDPEGPALILLGLAAVAFVGVVLVTIVVLLFNPRVQAALESALDSFLEAIQAAWDRVCAAAAAVVAPLAALCAAIAAAAHVLVQTAEALERGAAYVEEHPIRVGAVVAVCAGVAFVIAGASAGVAAVSFLAFGTLGMFATAGEAVADFGSSTVGAVQQVGAAGQARMVRIWGRVRGMRLRRRGGRVSRPPGRSAHWLVQFFCSPRRIETIYGPALSDLQVEYFDALGEGRPWKARWSLVRNHLGLARAIGFRVALDVIDAVLRWLSGR